MRAAPVAPTLERYHFINRTKRIGMVCRRQFLTGVATASTVAVAGCSSVPFIGGGPEGAAEQFFTAAQNGDVEAANGVVHPESSSYPVEESDLEDADVTVTEITQLSTRELVEREIERFSGSTDDVTEEEIEAEVERREDRSEATVEEIGADDYAWLLVTFEEGGEEEEAPIRMFQDDGDWYVLF